MMYLENIVEPEVRNEMSGKVFQVPTVTVQKAEEGGCGFGRFKPKWLEKLDNAKCLLVWLSLSSFFQGTVVNGLINVVITTIERRYNLSSSESGLIASSYDIASLICLIPVSYFGGAAHRNRWLSFGMILLGAGGILFSIPHFLSGFYEPSSTTSNICSFGNATTNSSPPTCTSPLSRFRYFFIFSQLLQGAGSSPLFTLGISYLGKYYYQKRPARGTLMGRRRLTCARDFTEPSRGTA